MEELSAEPLMEFQSRQPWWRSKAPWGFLALSLAVIVIILAVVLSLVVSSGPSAKHVLHIADLHYDSTNRTCACLPGSTTCCTTPCAVTNYGTYGALGCDSNLNLITSTMNALQALDPQPDYIILCGDLSGHRSPGTSTTITEVKAVKEMVSNVFPNKLIVGVIGNDDVYPDYCSNSTWFQLLYPVWQEAIECQPPLCYASDPGNQATWLFGGYYSIWPEQGLRIFALNTLWFSAQFNASCAPEISAPMGDQQMAWLAQGLSEAQQAGDIVYIVGHIQVGVQVFENPPGVISETQLWDQRYLRNYTVLVEQYSAIIAAQLFAHIHRDEFRLIRSDFTSTNGPFSTVALATSSVSPVFLNNPSFRMYTFDPSTFNLMDYSVWFFDLVANNVGRANGYSFLYKFSEQWGNITAGADGPPLGVGAMSLLDAAISGNLLTMSTFLSLRDVLFELDRYSFACSVQYVNADLFNACVAGGSGQL